MPSIPNPIDIIGQSLGGSLADVAESAFNQAMRTLWDFSLSLLKGVLGVIDHLTVPNLDPTAGPLSAVMPATIWVGAVLLVLLSFVQLGKAAMTGGSGLLHLFKGIGQCVAITACALGLLTTLVTAADAAARGIMSAGLHTSSWQGITAANAPWQNAVHGVSGAGLGLIALLGVLPAAIGLMVAALVREASILVIAATIPILAAGLVAEVTARWFWTGLRWMFALIMLTPAVALVISIGFKLAASASAVAGTGPQTSDTGQQAVTAFIGAAVLLISVFCPLALFKLFAFMDPGTPSGHSLRTSLSDFGSGSGATASAGGGGGGGGGAFSGAATPQEGEASDSVDSRWATALSALSAPHRIMAAGTTAAMAGAGPVLEAAGVGAGADGAGQPTGMFARGGSGPASPRYSQKPGATPSSGSDDGGGLPPEGPGTPGSPDPDPDPGSPDPGPGSPGPVPGSPAGDPDGSDVRPRPNAPSGRSGPAATGAGEAAEVADVAVIAG